MSEPQPDGAVGKQEEGSVQEGKVGEEEPSSGVKKAAARIRKQWCAGHLSCVSSCALMNANGAAGTLTSTMRAISIGTIDIRTGKKPSSGKQSCDTGCSRQLVLSRLCRLQSWKKMQGLLTGMLQESSQILNLGCGACCVLLQQFVVVSGSDCWVTLATGTSRT